MSLKADLITNEEKLLVIGALIDDLCKLRGAEARTDPRYAPMKAIARDIKQRIELPRNNALGEIERALRRAYDRQIDGEYSTGQLSAVAYLIIKHWPVLKQALEQFGELSAE